MISSPPNTKFHTVDLALSKISKLKGPVLYAFDFDGTLVGFRRKYGQVVLPAGTRRTLERLAKDEAVAVITGRSLENIAKKTEGLKI
ncbi:hypothetical protein NL343_28290, partial [Klebsiella pneumoniae]|nr:hypothetical protein [Klebsiella pneumoniae]